MMLKRYISSPCPFIGKDKAFSALCIVLLALMSVWCGTGCVFGCGLRRWSSSRGQEADREVTTRSIYLRGSSGNPSDSGKHGRTHQTGTRCRSLCRGRAHTISTVETMQHLCLCNVCTGAAMISRRGKKNMYHQLLKNSIVSIIYKVKCQTLAA